MKTSRFGVPPSTPIVSRILLLSGLLLTVAACPGPPIATDAVPVELKGEAVSLTPDAPRVEQRFTVVASAKEGKKIKINGIQLIFHVSVAWNDPEGSASEVNPWLRIRLVDEQRGFVEEKIFLAEATHLGQPQYFATFYPSYSDVCQRDRRECSATYRIELERQGPPAQGTFDVNWRAIGHSDAEGGEKEDFEVRLVYPVLPSEP